MNGMITSEEKEKFAGIISRSRRIVFFGGAGVSTASGIPDFRSEDGLYAESFRGLSPEPHILRFTLMFFMTSTADT